MLRFLTVLAIALSLALFGSASIASAQTYSLLISASPTRSNASVLQGATVSGAIYVFVSPESGARRVRFYLDDPQMLGSPRQIENNAPWDFAGGTPNGAPNAFNTSTVPDGSHVITAAVDRLAGGTDVVHATFTVSNAGSSAYQIQLSTSSNRSSPGPLDGSTVSGAIYVFTSPTSGVAGVRFYLDDPTMAGAPRLTDTAAPYDFAGTAAGGTANPFDTTTVANGTHTVTAAVDLSGGGTQVVHATFTVSNGTASGYQLLVSTSPDRSNPVALSGYSASGNIYVFTTPTSGVTRVRFYLDNPTMSGAPRQTETLAPYDFAGTAVNDLANAFNTASIAAGSHTITAAIDLSAGGTQVLHATFTVSSGGSTTYQLLLSTSPDRSGPVALNGATTAGNIYVFTSPTSGVAGVRFFLDDPAMAGAPRSTDTAAPYDFSGTAAGGAANPFNTTTLANGSHTITAAVDLSGGGTQVVNATFTVSNGSTSNFQLLVSTSPDRSNPVALNGYSATGNIYVFTSPTSGVTRVRFFLDNPSMTGAPRQTESAAPFDFAGTAANDLANPFNTGSLAAGSHTITAAIDTAAGTTVLTGTFTVGSTTSPEILLTPATVALSEAATSTTLNLNTTSGTASFTVTDNATWLTVAPTTGTSPASVTITANLSGLAPGTYNATVTASAPGYVSDTTAVTLTVGSGGGGSQCSPLPCGEILVDLPYTLEWNADAGKILDANGIGTGFTYVDQPSNGTGYIPSRVTVDIPTGTLRILTTAGLAFTTSNSQDNALGVGIDAPSQVSVISTTLVNPPAGTGNFEQAGLWFGNDQNNYIKLAAISTPTGTIIQALMEVNSAQAAVFQSNPVAVASATVTLTLRADPVARTVSATYQINGGPAATLGSFSPPLQFFSFDAAGIDPEIGTRTFTGVFASHRNAPSALTYTFGRFSVVADTTPPPPPPPGSITFTRNTFPVPAPTSMAWGPDGRLYVAEMFGKIHAITLDANKQVVSDQVITTLGSRLTLGLTVDPASTPTNVILWVSHSSPSLNAGVANSSTITRLSGSGFTTRQDVITGLPRALANHAVNSIHFGPDGKLYIANGGNTGAGAPNTANTEFGTRPEQPLSAALLVADVKAVGFQGQCASPLDDATGTASKQIPSTCHVTPFATGLRNTYDFVFHSNGHIYAPNNGLGVQGTFPFTPAPDCQGIVPYSSSFDPGAQPDGLNLLEQGRYYGHPNPARDECVFGDGHFQGVSALPNYTPPIFNLGNNRSANGTIEYTANNVCGRLKGEILIASYSVGDDITRARLSADGRAVVSSGSLAGNFNDPLPLALGPDGTIFVGELGANRVAALVPVEAGCWSQKAPLPQQLLDAGGTALGGKLYVVAGKTAAGPQSLMYIYDPTTNAWTTGANLPGAAVENPAVVALGGKLYAFGGSTAAFSGAVSNAAVYDPATNLWTPLAPMPTARGGATAQAINGLIYVAGGMDVTGASVATLQIYNPSTNSWTASTPMSTRRDNPGSAAFDGKLYVFGGRTRNADGTEVVAQLNTVEMFDPATQTWTAKAPMPTGRRTMVVGTLNGVAQVMGGERAPDGNAFNANEEYNPVTNSWRILEPMPTGRHGAVAGTINGVVYVVAGGPQAGSSFSSVNEAFGAQ
jgi:large repetitive protein